MTADTSTIPAPAAEASMGDVLAAIQGLAAAIAAPAAPAAPAPPRTESVPYSGPAGAASMAAPLAPEPVAAPPAQAPNPHPSETFAPGELGYFTYHDYRDPEGVNRVQVVSVAHVTDKHVHGIVLGNATDLAQFAKGQLTHAYPTAAS